MSTEQDKITEQDQEEFFRSFLNALLWTERDDVDGVEGQNLDENYGVEDFAPQVIDGLREQCNKFIEDNSDALLRVGEFGYEISQAGHDFCLSRNGHGAGFFDRGLAEDGDTLQKAAEAYGHAEAYLGDDRKIYVVGLERYGLEGTQPRSPKIG